MPKYCGFCGKTRQDAPVRVRFRRIPAFSRRAASLDAWLRSKGRLNEAKGGARVVAFYSLAAGSVERRRVSSRVGRNTPEPMPVILLGQLAMDAAGRGRGLGAGLLIDAGAVVQAIDERARGFYERFGFRRFSEREPLMIRLRISDLRAALGGRLL